MTITAVETPAAPPDERFWRRYSPRGEMPLSVSGSLAVHVLLGALLVLTGIYLAAYLSKPDQPLSIEPVRLGVPGKAPGDPAGKPGLAPGTKHEEDIGPAAPGDNSGDRPAPLTPLEQKRFEKEYDEPSESFLKNIDTDASRRVARLDGELRWRLSRGLARVGPPPKPGTPGAGGKGANGGKLHLTQREKRMLRWHMSFTANTGADYLAQLKSLGAILAFPVTEEANPDYKVVRDLKPGGKLVAEDVSKIARIYWIDDKPRSVKDIVAALGLKLDKTPSRFVAFMPEKLENELFLQEKRHVEKVLMKKFDEDRIEETRFKVVKTPKGYKVELTSVRMRTK